ncbi:MAG: DUF504 domain-containing protein [Desulfuromonas sp.]|nr:MAG: DUF504 domain-containing protein [Desulfuromonas sp.]
MKPIQELLSRIHWDEDFGDADFVLGYYDRVKRLIIRVPFDDLEFPPEDHFCFEVVDGAGDRHTIPFHRVREVWRNGSCIWQRRNPQAPGEGGNQ